ncbi:mpv17-like protein 2 [Chrysoperla carnea]|uniref:mpv17-like protein 2 n=1 Tax=Chrysoperla carnea TaxID=189513 RepID=UPI001D090E58|nr:mpv17-like protein 2 [Chrysoperla carnea]
METIFVIRQTFRNYIKLVKIGEISRRKIYKKYVITKMKTAFSEKYLFYTNIGLSIGLSGLGDVIQQNYELYAKQINECSVKRTAHMSASGLVSGVIAHNWYRFLDFYLSPDRKLKVAFRKLLLDQFIGSPIFLAAFFVTLAILEQSTFEEFKSELKGKAIKLYTAEWIVWPPAQMINFYLIPLQYRVLFDNLVSLGYNIYTSQVKHEQPLDNTKISLHKDH